MRGTRDGRGHDWREKATTGRQRAYLLELGCPYDVIPRLRGEAFDLIESLQRVAKRKSGRK